MHDLIFAVAFVAMIASPAMVAAFGGRKDNSPGPEVRSIRPNAATKMRPASRPRPIQKIAPAGSMVFSDGPTLPVHNSRGMANR
ncbi:MAG: hypothetical protein WB524_18140 [Acidobacteriaceae bacterium]|jgi:hypothetical protein